MYGQVVDRTRIDPLCETAAADLLAALDRVLQVQLHRLLGPDDVRLWLTRWAPDVRSRKRWEPPDGLAALRLVRVLRMLLREGVRVGARLKLA